MKRNWNWIFRALPWCILAAALIFTVGVYACYGTYGLDSDISSEMVLAELLNEEGALISPNWYYSTELRVISPVPLYQLGLMLFPHSWHAAHTFGLALALLGAALAIAYMGMGAGMGGAAALCAAVLILPVSEVHRFLFSSGGFYTAYVIVSCVLIGILLRLPRVRRAWLSYAALAIVGFVSGLSGVRMPMICMAPLMLACTLEMFDALRAAPSLSALASAEQTKIFSGAAVSAAAMMGGYLVNSKMLSGTYHFAAYGDAALGALNLPGVLSQLEWIVSFFGYRRDVPLLSMRGVCNVLITGACVLMLLSLIGGLLRRREHTAQTRIVLYFAAFAVACGMFLNIAMGEAGNEYSVGYYLMGVFALAMTAFMALAHMRCRMVGVRMAALLALSAVFGLQSLVYVRNYMPKEPLAHEDAAHWLLENGYSVGCSTFWNGNVLTELSDGEIRMYAYDMWTDDILTTWLQRTDHFAGMPENVKAFAYVDGFELVKGNLPFDEADLAWSSDYGQIYVYESTQELEALLGAWRAGLPKQAAE